jgi:flagellar biosynthesis chaperone FliJ
MKALKTIIKLHKNNIDSLKIKISEKQEEQNSLEIEFDRIAEEIKREQEFAKKSAELLIATGGYFYQAYEKQAEITSQIEKIQKELDELREELKEEYSAKKQYEHILNKKQEELRQLEKKKEESTLDEINMLKYNYENKNNDQ